MAGWWVPLGAVARRPCSAGGSRLRRRRWRRSTAEGRSANLEEE